MRSSLADIIAEIEALDPALTADKAELERIVDALFKARIDDEPREAFEAELLARVRTALANRTAAPSFFSIFLPRILMDTKYMFAGVGALTGALLVVAVSRTELLPKHMMSDRDSIVAVEKAGTTAAQPSAFGSLKGGEQIAEHSRSYSGVGGGGGEAMMAASEPAVAPSPQESDGPTGANVPSDKMMIYPGQDMKQASYAYEGDLSLPSGGVSVFRRMPPSATVPASVAIGGFVSDMLDWSKLGSSVLQNVSIIDKSSGFSANIDYQNGSVWINKTLQNDPYAGCTEPGCYDKLRLKEADMLADEQATAIAAEFVKSLGIDTSSYGAPEVTDDWRVWYARAEDKMQYYFPEQVSVLFPLLIDGKRVYEEYGHPYGMQVTVDVRSKTALSAGNFFFGKFETSSYAGVTDESKVRELLKRGGLSSWNFEGAQTVNIALSAPTEGFVHISRWLPESQQSQELFVPALVFDVKDAPEGLMNERRNVLVPLAEEMLTLPEEGGAPVPMPLEDGPAIRPAQIEPVPAEAPAEPEPTPANKE